MPERLPDPRVADAIDGAVDAHSAAASADLRLIEARLREREHAPRSSEERHRLLADTLPHGVVHQAADGKIIDMNRAASIPPWSLGARARPCAA